MSASTNPESRSPAPGSSPRLYSPFWAVLAVFLTLIVLQLFSLRQGARDRTQLRATHVSLGGSLTQANTVTLTVERVGQDLLAMAAANNAEAAKIVAEFRIATNAVPAAATPAKPKN